ncbi:MAG: AAA family ATPase [Bacteroidetes bacterium]|nr:AAA family ATPase [Bacteroidota bacterium]
MQPKLILFCGPSGSGKTTLVKHLLNTFPQLCFSVSATTRSMRNNEKNGGDYYFMSVDEFHSKIQNDEFLECGVHIKGRYGNNLLDVFVKPPSIADLRKRLVARASESLESLETRVRKAEFELTYASRFSNVIVNQDINTAKKEAELLVANFLELQS